MSIFGIKKNEHGGGSLVPVEGGSASVSVLYLKDDGLSYNYAYHDKECTVKATKSELVNLFMNGLLLFVETHEDIVYRPTYMMHMGDDTDYVSIHTSSSSVTIMSSEYVGSGK